MSDSPSRPTDRSGGVRARRSAVDHIADHGEPREVPELFEGGSLGTASISTSTFSIVPQGMSSTIDEDLGDDEDVVASEVEPERASTAPLDEVRAPVTDRTPEQPVAVAVVDSAPAARASAERDDHSGGRSGAPATPEPTASTGATAKRTAAKPLTSRPPAAKSAPVKSAPVKSASAKSTTATSSTATSTTATSATGKPTTAKPTSAKSTTAKSTTGKSTSAKSTTPKRTVARSTAASATRAQTPSNPATPESAEPSSAPSEATPAARAESAAPTPSGAVAEPLDTSGPPSSGAGAVASETIVVDLPPAEEPDVPPDEHGVAIDEVPVTTTEDLEARTSSIPVATESGTDAESEDAVVERPSPPRAAYAGLSATRAQAGAPESSSMLTAERLIEDRRDTRRVPEGFWQKLLFDVSGKRIRVADSRAARSRRALTDRIARPLTGGARFVPVLTRKGGVGKTTVTTLLGMALADARDDRVIAVDANPDRGTLAERLSRRSDRTVRDLVRGADDVSGYADFSALVSRDATRLDVLASDTDPHISQAFDEDDYDVVARLASQYYSIVLTDCGTGIVHSVMGATLRHAHSLVIVSGTSVDEARSAAETLSWLEANGYAELASDAVVVVNATAPGTPPVRLDEIERHFDSRVRSIVRIPFDAHLATGAAVTFADLRPETREAAREVAAAVVEGLTAATTGGAARG